MCLRPKTWFLKTGDAVTIACQECRQCLDQKTHDWVGRNIAESKTAKAAHAVTLTYGRDAYGNADHPRAKVLTYSDVQKWLKLLRYHGYPCRYFLSGEYGTLKGRCHWHLIIYWLDKVPAWAGFDSNGHWSDNHMSRGLHKVRFNHQRLDDQGKPALVRGEPAFWWPHGWTEVSTGATVDAIKYVCKYIRKEVGQGKQSHFMMSKQPPLGAAYFAQRAERYVAAGLAPQGGMGYLDGALHHGMGGYSYSWSDVTKRNKNGGCEPLQFQLRGVSLDFFLAHYVATWETVYPGRPMPASMMLEEWLVPGTWKDASPDSEGDFKFERWLANAEAAAAVRPPITDEDCRRARRGHPLPVDKKWLKKGWAEFQREFEALRPEFEARARQILWHRSEYNLGKKRH